MEFLLKEIATYINGEVTGDGEIKITGVSGIGEATEGEVTFVSNPKYISMIENTKASAIIVTRELAREDKNLIICENPYLAFAEVMRLFSSVHYTPRGVHKDAFIGENVEIGNDVSIYPFVYIGNNVQIGAKTIIYPGVFIDDGVIIGSETLLYSNVSIREKCKIGNRVIIHCNSVIGSDGFGFTQDGEVHQKIPQIGSVRIDDDVEIGASNTIDRATMGVTWIPRRGIS